MAIHGERWDAFVVEPKSASCGVYDITQVRNNPAYAATVLGPAGTDVFHWNWRVGHASAEWSGEAVKESNKDIKYDLKGQDLGDRTVISAISAKRAMRIGAYLLVHRDDDGTKHEDYIGFWNGRDCSIIGSPYVQCPMVLRKHVDGAKQPELPRSCTLEEPEGTPEKQQAVQATLK